MSGRPLDRQAVMLVVRGGDLFALADDGTIWRYTVDEPGHPMWVLLPGLPDKQVCGRPSPADGVPCKLPASHPEPHRNDVCEWW